MQPKKPIIAAYIGLFALLYGPGLILVSYVLWAFDITPPSMTNIFAICLAVYITNKIFVRKFERSFSKGEYFKMVLGCALFDLVFQVSLVILMLGQIAIFKDPGGLTLILLGHVMLIAVGFSPWAVNRLARLAA